MNFRNLFLVAFAAIALVACGDKASTTETGAAGDAATADASAVTYTLDPAATTLSWKGTNAVAGKSHNGTISVTEGTVSVENNNISAGSFTIDMNSIMNADLTEADKNGMLVGHLKSPDFFDAAAFPTASFAVTRSEVATGDPAATHYVYGNLTLKGITNEIKVPAQVSVSGDDLKITAAFAIDRAKWEVKYGSGSFFENLGDKLINDEIEFTLDLVARKAAAATANGEAQPANNG